jgi:hypothetical protein
MDLKIIFGAVMDYIDLVEVWGIWRARALVNTLMNFFSAAWNDVCVCVCVCVCREREGIVSCIRIQFVTEFFMMWETS